MILFNVYLSKVYHVRNILMFVNFWTEATNLPTFVEIREILLTLPPMQSARDLDNLISDMRTVETLGDGNSALWFLDRKSLPLFYPDLLTIYHVATHMRI